MVPEIPIATRQILDIGPRQIKRPFGLRQRNASPRVRRKPSLVGRCSKKVAREDDVQMCVFHGPRCRAVLRKKRHLLGELARGGGIQVHPIFPLSGDLVDEFPPAATEVENDRIFRNPSGEEFLYQNPPDARSISRCPREAHGIFSFQFLGHCHL